ncbi:hypothetical protein S101446_00165 [Komagataeibacter europaeus]|nr:hypothetical protein S101446_00165 [Komagataeibacter europaeus]
MEDPFGRAVAYLFAGLMGACPFLGSVMVLRAGLGIGHDRKVDKTFHIAENRRASVLSTIREGLCH